ncbi:MAG: S24/S26 family peptidase [Firmicutes bacterium]|nr:S24/S26 family peptidase [Bacillota bacterium]
METQKGTTAYIERCLPILAGGQTLPLPVLGSSMTPFLGDRRDSVLLRAPESPPKVGDILLYRRDSGAFILHRVHSIQDGTYTMVGDAQTVLEPGIRADQVCGVVISAQRKGRTQKPGCFWWFFFSRIWIRMVPLRPKILGIYRRMRGKHHD